MAVQCLMEAFGLTEAAVAGPGVPDLGVLCASASQPAPQPQLNADAERLKARGNEFIAAKRPQDAADSYTQAIALDPTNAVYYCNRAAAWAMLGEHGRALQDARRSAELSPAYSKAFSRMGRAQLALGDAAAAVPALEQAVALEPSDASLKAVLEQARARARASATGNSATDTAASYLDDSTVNAAFNTSSPNPLPTNMPGAFDLAGVMANPQFRQMASQMMNSSFMEQMMKDPRTEHMVRSMMGDPDMAGKMKDFMGGSK